MKKKITSLIFALLWVGLSVAWAVGPQPVQNTTKNTFHATIQAAIAAADDGNVILLLENLTGTNAVVINRELTLDGNNKSINFGITVAAEDVTIKDLTIEIEADGSSNKWAKYPFGAGDLNAAIFLQFTIDAGNAVPKAGNAMIDNVTFNLTPTGTTATAISVGQQNKGIKILNSTFGVDGATWGNRGILISRGAGFAEMKSNDFTGVYNALYIEVEISGNANTNTEFADVINNTFAGNNWAAIVRSAGDGPIDYDSRVVREFNAGAPGAEAKFITTENPASAKDVFQIFATNGQRYAYMHWDYLTNSLSHNETRTYNSEENDFIPPPVYNVDKNRYYATIQAAINAADDNDEIVILTGTYDEVVEDDKSLTFKLGSSKGVAAINGSLTLSSPGSNKAPAPPSSSSTVEIELFADGECDQWDVSGLLDLNELTELVLIPAGTINPGDVFTIINYGSLSGEFNKINGVTPTGNLIKVNGYYFLLDYGLSPSKNGGGAITLTTLAPMFKLQIDAAGGS